MTGATVSKKPRKLPRSNTSGKFEVASPLTDASLRRYVMGNIHAVDTLMPTLLAFAHASESPGQREAMMGALRVLVLIRETFDQQLDMDASAGPADAAAVERIVLRAEGAWRSLFEAESLPRIGGDL